MVIFLPLLISLIGLILYGLVTDPKVQTVGLNMFWVGLLAFLLLYPGHPVTVLK